MSRPRLITLLLALITLAVFLPAGRFAFVNFDDNDYITDNPFVKNGLTFSGLRWAFTAFHASNWHPLTWLSHMVDCTLFQLNAGGHHLDSVLFHAANVALLFSLVWRLTREIWPAAFIAALFAWHSLHVESVAWVSERKDVLSTFFALLALLSYVKFVQEKSRRGFWLALLFFALGLLSKPMLVTLPFVLLLLDFWPLKRFSAGHLNLAGLRPLVAEKAPFFALTVVSCLVTFLAQRRGEAVISLTTVPLLYRLENAPVAAVNYLLKLFWPVNLCAYYTMPARISELQVVLSVAVLILVSAAAWRWRVSKPYLLMGWLWFLGTLVPVIGILQVGGQSMADRYTYIPSIGFFLAVVFLARDLAGRMQLPRFITNGTMILTLAACVLATEHQLQFWRDGETLFRRMLVINPQNDIALINLGVALEQQGRFDEALTVYRQAAKINPARYQLHNNIGKILAILGRHEESLAAYRTAIGLHSGAGFLHSGAGMELAALGRFDEAAAEFATAEKLDPNLPGPHLEAAKVLFKQGHDPEAVAELHDAVRLDPDNYLTLAAVAHYLATSENASTRDGKSALPLALKANELSGHSQPMVFDILGMALAENGDFTNAITCAQNALDLAAAAHMQGTDPIRARLELYRKQLPWRESFRTTNLPSKY